MSEDRANTQAEMPMSIESACADILGPEIAHAIILDKGIHWAVVAAMAEAKVSDNPAALAAIDHFRAGGRSQPPRALDAMARKVLAYHPQPKSKPAKSRKRRAIKIAKDAKP